jgi:hypothetical protein
MENVMLGPAEIEIGPIFPPMPTVTSRHPDPDEREEDAPTAFPRTCAPASRLERIRTSPSIMDNRLMCLHRNMSDYSFDLG